jgi:hypothetical protein
MLAGSGVNEIFVLYSFMKAANEGRIIILPY